MGMKRHFDQAFAWRRGLRVALATAFLAGTAWAATSFTPAMAQTVRIKDVANFEGVRENQLIGYGLVVGLNGTGDSLNRAIFTRESLLGMLERLGVNAPIIEACNQVLHHGARPRDAILGLMTRDAKSE